MSDSGRSDDDRGPRHPASDGGEAVPDPTEDPLGWYMRSEGSLVVASRDVLSSVLLVGILGLALFAISGVWPPMVAIESGSMEPNMHTGDLVLVVEEDRYTSELALEQGVVTRERGAESSYDQFGHPGSVIVFQPNGGEGTPIIHRAVFYVEEDENWVERADPQYLGPADSCEDVLTCPAPHEGFITRGDANGGYDQIDGQSTVVHPDWVKGRAAARIPYLGCIRLGVSGQASCF